MSARNTIALLIGAALILSACESAVDEPGTRAVRSVPVIVEPLRTERERTRVEAVGTSRAAQSVNVRAAAAGEVVAVNFEAGQPVKKGDVLLELDSRDEKLAVDLAEVRLADAERLLARYQRSGASGAIVPTDLDAARTAVKSARIDLDRARVELADRKVVALFDGHVDITDVEPGDRINADTLITTLDNRNQLLVNFELPEVVFDQLQLGNPISALPWSERGGELKGEIVDIASRINPATRTFSVRASIANQNDSLRPGMSFRVAIDIQGKTYPVIGETAVSWGADGAYLWRVENGVAERIAVNIVQRRRGRILLSADDVDEGDLIVVEGTQRMRAGVQVDYRNGDTANASARQPDGVVQPGAT